MLPHRRSTSLEFPCRMMNNYTQMTTRQLLDAPPRDASCVQLFREPSPGNAANDLDCLFVYSVLKRLQHLVKGAFDGGGPSQEPLRRIR